MKILKLVYELQCRFCGGSIISHALIDIALHVFKSNKHVIINTDCRLVIVKTIYKNIHVFRTTILSDSRVSEYSDTRCSPIKKACEVDRQSGRGYISHSVGDMKSISPQCG